MIKRRARKNGVSPPPLLGLHVKLQGCFKEVQLGLLVLSTVQWDPGPERFGERGHSAGPITQTAQKPCSSQSKWQFSTPPLPFLFNSMSSFSWRPLTWLHNLVYVQTEVRSDWPMSLFTEVLCTMSHQMKLTLFPINKNFQETEDRGILRAT